MKKWLFFLVISIEIISCNNIKGVNNSSNNVAQITLSKDNIYYINAPGGVFFRVDPDDISKGVSRLGSPHKRKVLSVDEIEGWKKVTLGNGHSLGWIKNKYLVKSIDEIILDYNFIQRAVGRYNYNSINIIRRDDGYNDGNMPHKYDGDTIVLDYSGGDYFFINHVYIKDGIEKAGNRSRCIVPNDVEDSFKFDSSDGKHCFDDDYYFINEGIKIERTWKYFDKKFVYEIIYIKEQ
jgi:hypothetical protein